MADGKHPLDPIIIPAKRFVFRSLLRGDQQRYLRLRQRAARVAAATGLYERQSLRHAKALLRPGQVALDVGASFGSYTDELARAVGPSGQVHAFEPQRDVYELLRSRFAGTRCVTVVNYALADREGVGEFRVPDIGDGVPETALGGLARASDGGLKDGGTTVSTLDRYCEKFTELAFVKIDAEGWDLEVLRGGRETLRRLRPVVQVEVNDAAMAEELETLASSVGYVMDDQTLNGVNRLLRPA